MRNADTCVGISRILAPALDIAVLPEHQGRGLGKMLMREIRAYIER